ncbi:MAG: DNA internalization-related competence protein ComEC/Rec2 [Elusimicrobia bacterium RIFOXYA2_FULL_39_19]|nr:MAG: DNA internalization-related competence protein ComEC/Rec2 [Elusimicrobia bacterium RIFOXYA2_FULL_39_19]
MPEKQKNNNTILVFLKNYGFIALVLLYITALIFADGFGYFKQNTTFLEGLFNSPITAEVTVSAPVQEQHNRIEFPAELTVNGKKAKLLFRYYYAPPSDITDSDVVKITGLLLPLPKPRNLGQFDYAQYLSRKGYAGIVNVTNMEVIKKGRPAIFEKITGKLRSIMIDSVNVNPGSAEAAVLQAMFVGEKKEIPQEINEMFIDSGLMHVLVVSGLNVVYIAGMFYFLFGFLPMPNKIRLVLCIIPIILYCFATGANPPVVRASVLSLAFIACFLLEREKAVYHAFALSALIILVFDPQALFGASMQLSFAACLGIVYISPKLLNPVNLRMTGKSEVVNSKARTGRKIIYYLLSLFFVSLSAQLAVAPLLAKYFYKISVISLVSNIIVVPYVGVILALCFVQFLIYLFLPFLLPVSSYFCAFSASVLISIVEYFAKTPSAVINTGAPSLFFIAGYFAALILFFRVKTVKAKAVILAGCCVLMFVSAQILFSPRKLAVTFLDVGEGNAVYLKTPENKNIFIDCGGIGINTGDWTIKPFLMSKGIRTIDKVIITTDNWAHYSGFKTLLKNFKVKEIILAGDFSEDPQLSTYIKEAEIKGAKIVTLIQEELLYSGKIKLKNIGTGCIALDYGSFKVLFTADELPEIKTNEKYNVLQMPAHGRNILKNKALIDSSGAQYLVVSAGNKTATPKSINLFSTYKHGAIEITFDSKTFQIIPFIKNNRNN